MTAKPFSKVSLNIFLIENYVSKSINPPYLSTAILRPYATQSSLGSRSNSSRKQVTVVSDDGKVQWKDLSTREKVARTTQQTFNFGLILTGLIMTGGVIYFLYSDVFATDSKTRHFNRAVDRIRNDPQARDILGTEKKIRAFGEPTANKWARARPLSSDLRKDKYGTEHFRMHFNVEGSSRSGVVNLHLVKHPGETEFNYKYLVLEVKGHPMIYLENADALKNKEIRNPGVKLFGVNWR